MVARAPCLAVLLAEPLKKHRKKEPANERSVGVKVSDRSRGIDKPPRRVMNGLDQVGCRHQRWSLD
jgi:hypothetical protein